MEREVVEPDEFAFMNKFPLRELLSLWKKAKFTSSGNHFQFHNGAFDA